MDLRKELNPSQYEAVTTIEGPLLVTAGAGSGKTRIIEYRVAHMIQNGIDPRSILLLTFTRRAAREMIQRTTRREPKAQRSPKHWMAAMCSKRTGRTSRPMRSGAPFLLLTRVESAFRSLKSPLRSVRFSISLSIASRHISFSVCSRTSCSAPSRSDSWITGSIRHG